MLYGTITEFCSEESCPVMTAGPKYEYHWADGTTVKKPIKCSAPKYIDYLMTWVQDQLDDETIFPSKIGVPFPKNFVGIAKTIFKRLFRVYAHVYHQHFKQVVQLGEKAHLNTSFKHFIFFVQEFTLIEKRELAPLSELIDMLNGNGSLQQQQNFFSDSSPSSTSRPESFVSPSSSNNPELCYSASSGHSSTSGGYLDANSSAASELPPQLPARTNFMPKSILPAYPVNQYVDSFQQAPPTPQQFQPQHHGLPTHMMFQPALQSQPQQHAQQHQQYQQSGYMGASSVPAPIPPPAYHQQHHHHHQQQPQQSQPGPQSHLYRGPR